jgi:hypothetical protein
MFGWFKKLRQEPKLPELFAQEDLTGFGLTMDYLVAGLGINTEAPAIGDVIIRLVSCSMGMSVRRDVRYRVISRNEPPFGVLCRSADGEETRLHIAYMRRHTKISRTWFLMD